jgi:hypothetical protein
LVDVKAFLKVERTAALLAALKDVRKDCQLAAKMAVQ